MSDTYILELNEKDADWVKPGEYHIQLSEPVIINEGDQLSFRMASLDSNIQSTDSIIIPRDEAVTIKYSYYDVDYSSTDKYSANKTTAWAAPTWDYYAAYSDSELVNITSITLGIVGYRPPDGQGFQGSYIVSANTAWSTVDSNVNLITTISYIDESGNIQTADMVGGNAISHQYEDDEGQLYYGPAASGSTFQLVLPVGFSSIRIRDGSLKVAACKGYWPGGRLSSSNPALTFGIGAYTEPISEPAGSQAPNGPAAGVEYDNDIRITPSQLFVSGVGSTPVVTGPPVNLNIQYLTVTLPSGRYDANALAVKLTQLISGSGGVKPVNAGNQIYTPANPILTRTDDPDNTSMRFRRLDMSGGNVTFNNANTYYYWNTTTNAPVPYYIGASQFELAYGQAGQVFQLSYAHTPMNNPTHPGSQDIALYNDTSGGYTRFHPIRQATGIVIHDMSPKSLWQTQMGIYNSLVVPLQADASGVLYYTKSQMENKITYGFEGVSTFILPAVPVGTNYPDPRKAFPLVPITNPLYLDVTGQSRAIIGQTVNINKGGYYLIEVLNVFRRVGGYLDNKSNKAQISAICSTQYQSFNTITAYADSGIPYLHRGNPYLITDATVRILDPITKEPVTTLGSNNTVFVQIDKQFNPLPVENPAPQQEHEGVKHE